MQHAVRERYKGTLKDSLKDFSPGNRLHRIERSGVYSSEVEMTMKQRQSAKRNESVRAQSQSQWITISVIFRIDVLFLQQTV